LFIETVVERFKTSYLNEDWDKAHEILIKNKQSFHKGLFHYNLGTVLFKKGELAAARFHFEKSIKNGYYKNNSIHNLQVVKNQLNTETYEKPMTKWEENYMIVSNISPQIFLSISLLLTLTLLLLRKKIKTTVLITLIVASFFPAGLGFYFSNSVLTAVTMQETSISEGPSEIFGESSKIPEGIKVVIGKEKDKWYYIKYPLRYSGWVKRSQLGLL
jgi:tetratricopeptide (TPR) repeat protein